MTKRRWFTVSSMACLSLGCALLAGCGVGVTEGGQNAATHPALGIWVSPTVGGANISGHPSPKLPYPGPPSPPASPPAGLKATVAAIKSAVTGGCWQDAHQGNIYGAYDQVFWWQGSCGDTIVQATIELYPSAAAARAHSGHGSASALMARYRSGAVVVDVYANAPQWVVSDLSGVKGLKALPGYGG